MPTSLPNISAFSKPGGRGQAGRCCSTLPSASTFLYGSETPCSQPPGSSRCSPNVHLMIRRWRLRVATWKQFWPRTSQVPPWRSIATGKILSANRAVANLVAGAEPIVLRPPVNLLRLFLHPAGLASRIVNLMEWRAQIVARLRRQIEASGDSGLIDLLEEIRDYPRPPESLLSRPIGSHPLGSGSRSMRPRDTGDALHAIAIPLQLVTIDGTLSFFSATTRFGMPADITLSELIIEAFLPADQLTAEILQRNVQRALTLDLPATAAEDHRLAAQA
jgi:hypothetical protein